MEETKMISPEMIEWLRENDSQLIRHYTINASDIYLHSVNGKTILVWEYAEDNGWDVFIPADLSNNVKNTIENLTKFIKK